MAHAYSHLYGVATTGLRFFTVYGPGAGLTWRRLSSRRASSQVSRSSFTTTANTAATSPLSRTSLRRSSASLIVRRPRTPAFAATILIQRRAPRPIACTTSANQPVALLDFISVLEQALGQRPKSSWLRPGDVADTLSDSADLQAAIDFRPHPNRRRRGSLRGLVPRVLPAWSAVAGTAAGVASAGSRTPLGSQGRHADMASSASWWVRSSVRV